MTKKETIEKLTKKDCEYLINNYIRLKDMLKYLFKEDNPSNYFNKGLKLKFNEYKINYKRIQNKKTSLIWQSSSKEFKEITDNSRSFKEILIKLNVGLASSNYITLKRRFSEENLDYNFYKEEYKNYTSIKRKRENKYLFVKDINISRGVVRKRIIKDELIPYECKLCFKQPFSNGKPLSLTLDHINGVNYDHRLKNLRFLCPDCDRQQETFGKKNKVMINRIIRKGEINNDNITYIKKNKYCKRCNKKVEKNNKSGYCRVHYSQGIQKKYKDIKEVVIMVENQGYLQTGKHYKVSDNTIRKWLKKENINLIKSQKTWEEVFMELFIYINKNEEITNKIKNLIQYLRTKYKQNNLDKNKIDLLNLLSRDILHPEEKYQKEWISNINKIITWIDTNKIIPKRRIKNKEESSISEKIRTILRKDKNENEFWQEEKIIQLKDLMKQYQK